MRPVFDAYSALTFLRVESKKKRVSAVGTGESKNSSFRKMTIPRIELMGCTIGAIGTSIKNVLERDIQCFYWSDSTTTMAWISRNDEWGTFVGNRVREIVKLTKANKWRHVPGKMNPADFPSRGGSIKELLQSIWWEGPEWLKHPSKEWPNEEFQVDEEAVDAERKKSVVASNNFKIVAIPKAVRII